MFEDYKKEIQRLREENKQLRNDKFEADKIIDTLDDKISDLKAEIENHKILEYVANKGEEHTVNKHNELADDYEKLRKKYNKLVHKHNNLVDRHNGLKNQLKIN